MELYRVLLVDDEEDIREGISRKMDWLGLGFSLVGEAANGQDALELAESLRPDVILTDIKMPFMDGLELCRILTDRLPAARFVVFSGFDAFEYAKQAIQYNIISYMLKPLTLEGLGAELRNIRQKIDAQFALFRQAVPRADEQDLRAAFLMPLVLDDYPDPDGAAQAEALARQCGLLRDADVRPYYTVMVSILLNEDGSNCTDPSFPSSVHTLSEKYLRGSSFFASGKVISVLLGNPSDFEEYLHILADEIPQMASRVLGKRCRIGVSRPANSLSALHDAYREAMEALRQGDKTEAGAQFISDLAPAVKGGNLLCKRALDTLDQYYMDADLSLVSLSGMLDVSPNHLSACIKKYAGETFINILIRKRMEAARDLLSTSSLKIQEIAQRCGYTDQHYFSYCFKKYCGESPNAMRRRLDLEKAGEPS